MSKLCIFVHSMAGGGAESKTVRLANQFSKKGLDVTLLLIHRKGPYLSEVSEDVKIVSLARPLVRTGFPGKYLATVWALWRIKPSHILSIGEWPNMLAPSIVKVSVFRRFFRTVQVIIAEQSTQSFIHDPKNADRHSRQEVMPADFHTKSITSYQAADIWVAVSGAVLKGMKKVMPEAQKSAYVIYNPFDLKRIDQLAREPADHPWLNKKTLPVLLAVGRLERLKDYPVLLEAVKLTRQKQPVRLIILGEGPMERELKRYRDQLGLGDCVDFVGFKINPYAYYASSDLLVHASQYEGFGNIFIEAMACGLPMAVTDCDTPKELMGSEEFVKITPVGDPEALAASILDLLSSEFDSARIREKAAKFDVELVADQYLNAMGLKR